MEYQSLLKFWLKTFLVLFVSTLAWNTATVTGKVSTPSTSVAAGSNFITFELQGCGNNPAHATQAGEAGTLTSTARFPIDASGNIKAADGVSTAAIVRNDQISCGGVTTSTFYLVTIYINNSAIAGQPQKYRITSGAFDLNSATPITVNPVVVAPTGDTTYCRLDAGNCGFTGNITGVKAAFSHPGVFTDTQQNEFTTSILNGLDLGAEYLASQRVDGIGAAHQATDALAGGVKVPVTSTVHQSDAVAGYVSNGSSTGGAVGLFGAAHCTIGSSKCWGFNTVAWDDPSLTGVSLFNELDFGVNNASTVIGGLNCNGVWEAQSTSANCFYVNKPISNLGGNYFWSSAFLCAIGATDGTSSRPCFSAQPVATGNSQQSQALVFNSTSSGGANIPFVVYEDAVGDLIFNPAGKSAQVTPGGDFVVGSNTSRFISGASNPSTVGVLSMSHTDAIAWRNAANSGNLTLGFNGSDQFTFPSAVILPAIGNGLGLQAFTTSTTCTTGASIGATCTTAAITLPVAEPDTNYRLSCTGQGVTNVPIVQTYTKSNTTFTITIAALTAAAATFSSYDCLLGHN